MRNQLTFETLSLCLLLISIAPALAQTIAETPETQPSSVEIEDTGTPVVVETDPVPGPSESAARLAALEANNAALRAQLQEALIALAASEGETQTCAQRADKVTGLMFDAMESADACKAELQASATALETCQADLNLQINTNITLQRRLNACEAPSDNGTATIGDMETTVTESGTDIRSETGVGSEAAFGPASGSATEPVVVPDIRTAELEEEVASLNIALEGQAERHTLELSAAEDRVITVEQQLRMSDERNAELIAEADELRAEVGALSDRLVQFGISMEEGFVYARRTAFDSFLRQDQIVDLPRLDVGMCGDAIAWLQEKVNDPDSSVQPFRFEIWAWNGDAPVICEIETDGTVAQRTIGRNSSEQAHVVVFQ